MKKPISPIDVQQWRMIGDQIRIAREKTGMTQLRLSELVGVSDDTISRLERGRACEVSFVLICKIGKELQVPIEQLCPSMWRVQGHHYGDGIVDPEKARENAGRLYEMLTEMQRLITAK